MNLLITGGAGYLGSIITKKALERGHRATVLDKMYYLTPLVEQHLKGAKLIEADVCNIGVADDNYDFAFHLAAMSNDPSADLDPDATFRVNIEGSEAVGTYCAERGIPLIFASTASVYGFVEWELCREDTRVNPQSTYAESKAQAEARLWNLVGCKHLNLIVLRMATLFGWSPRMRYDLVVNTLVANAVSEGRLTAYGGGECWRPLLYVGDAADAWLRIAETVHGYKGDDDHMAWWEEHGGACWNLVHKNYRLLELIFYVQYLLEKRDIPCRVEIERSAHPDRRSYAMSGDLAAQNGIACPTGIVGALDEMLGVICNGISFGVSETDIAQTWHTSDFSNPIYRNVEWMKVLHRARERISLWELIP